MKIRTWTKLTAFCLFNYRLLPASTSIFLKATICMDWGHEWQFIYNKNNMMPYNRQKSKSIENELRNLLVSNQVTQAYISFLS